MTSLVDIQEAVSQGNYKYTLHAVQRTTERHISRLELEEVIAKAEIKTTHKINMVQVVCYMGKRILDEYFIFKSAFRLQLKLLPPMNPMPTNG